MTTRSALRPLLRRPLRLLGTLVLGATSLLAACDEDEDRRPPPTGQDVSLDAFEVSPTDTGVVVDTAQPDVDAQEDADVTETDLADADDTTDTTDADAPDIDDADIDVGPTGPLVTLVAPSVPADLSSDEILTTNRLQVDCRVEQRPDGAPVDSESVLITVTDADGTTLSGPGNSTVSTTLFSAEFDVSAAPNGALTVTCEAADRGNPVATASDTVETFLDHGPTLTVISPAFNGAYSQQLDVVFRAEAAPVSPSDTMAEVDPASVRVFVGNTEIPNLTLDPNGNYVTTIDFDDPTLFSPPLDGPALLVVEAANTRTPTPVTRIEEVPFVADELGPLIIPVTPVDGAIVGGLITLTVKVTDPVGVDPSSVRATIAGTLMRNLASIGNDEYSALVDARGLNPNVTNVTIEYFALDGAGNLGRRSIQVSQDVHPPLIDLDPPMIREITSTGKCSVLFDPLGDDAANDLEPVPQLFEPRVRIEDQGNGAPSTGTVIPIGGVNDSAVQLFVLDNVAQALLVDTNADGVCDEINPNLTQSSMAGGLNSVVALNLGPAAPKGSSYLASWAGDDMTTHANGELETAFGTSPFVADGTCEAGTASQPPMGVCPESTGLLRIIKSELGGLPVVYGLPPLTQFNCAGSALDALGINLSEGWACIAVRAEDTLGNIGVSQPLRVCIDLTDDGQVACADTDPAPDCTGTYDPQTATDDPAIDCTPPAGYAAYPLLNRRKNY